MPATSGSWKTWTAPICSMCRITCASFGSFLSQLLCSASRVRASATDDTSFSSKPAAAKVIHQGAMVVAGRLEPDPDRQAESLQRIAIRRSIVVARVRHRHPAAALLAGDGDQHLVTVLGNVDAYQNTGIRSMLSLGHSRSPLWCGSQNHHRDLRPGYGRLLRDLRAPQAAITFDGDQFPTCYGPEFIAKAVREWIAAVGARTAFIEPGSPWENGYCESFNSKLRDELLNGEIFYSLAEAKIVIESWRRHYNTRRPHSSLGYRPPAPEVVRGRLRHPEPLRRPPQP